MRRLGLMVCVVLVSGVANAGYTYVVDTVDASDGQAGSQFVTSYGPPPWPYLPSNADWGWKHDYTAQLPTSWDAITRAELIIRAWDVDNPVPGDEDDVITLDGQVVGLLTGVTNQWSETTFDLLALGLTGYLTDGVANMWINIDATPASGRLVAVDWSRIEIDFYERPVPPPPPPGIPAPGALLLGSLGAGVVGWLRRRNTL